MTPKKVAQDRTFQELIRRIAVDAIDIAVGRIKDATEEEFVNIFDDPDLTFGDEYFFTAEEAEQIRRRPRAARRMAALAE